jgi:hypothetical protein
MLRSIEDQILSLLTLWTSSWLDVLLDGRTDFSLFTVWAASWLDVLQHGRVDFVAIYGVGGLLA